SAGWRGRVLNVRRSGGLEQCVDERSCGAASEDHECADEQQHDDDRSDPPLLVLAQVVDEFAGKAALALLRFFLELAATAVSWCVIRHVVFVLGGKLPAIRTAGSSAPPAPDRASSSTTSRFGRACGSSGRARAGE